MFWRVEAKTVPGKVFRAGGAKGLINERLKLLVLGLPGSFSVHSIACLSPAVFRLEKFSAVGHFLTATRG